MNQHSFYWFSNYCSGFITCYMTVPVTVLIMIEVKLVCHWSVKSSLLCQELTALPRAFQAFSAMAHCFYSQLSVGILSELLSSERVLDPRA